MIPDGSQSAKIFEYLSERVWNRIRRSKELGIRLGEVGITDDIVLEIAQLQSPNVLISQTSQASEPHEGTDWEWWIGSRGGGWTRYAVQAKRINVESNIYDKLGHYVGRKRQAQVLAEYASRSKAVALYCFYNYVEEYSEEKHWHCHLDFRDSQFGCTIVPVSVVQSAVKTRGSRTFQRIHQHSDAVPWRCLFCSGNSHCNNASLALEVPELRNAHKVLPPALNEMLETTEMRMLQTAEKQTAPAESQSLSLRLSPDFEFDGDIYSDIRMRPRFVGLVNLGDSER